MKGATCPSVDKRTVNLRIPLELATLVESHFSSDGASPVSRSYISALESVAGDDPLSPADLKLIEAERAANKLRNDRTLERLRKGI